MRDAPMMQSTQLPTTGRILLVDDEEAILKAYGRILEEQGFFVERVSDGLRVIEALQAGSFDLVISDIRLAGIDGIDVLRTVRQQDPDLPVVLMTAAGDVESAVRAIELGAVRYLLKPVDPKVLGQTAGHAIRLRQIARVERDAFERYGASADRDSSRAELTARFDRALDQLRMAYQPIVCWSRRSVLGYEALVRTGEESLQRPDQLFSAAGILARIQELGRTIRATVAKDISSRPSQAQIYVNLHPRDLEDPELFSSDSPLAAFAHDVVLELTERASLEGMKDVRARVSSLRQLGFRLAIDDLGAGYSGLSSFAQLEPEVVKLDMSLTRGIDTEETKRKLVRTMMSLCGDLGILVIAEGVETVGERDTLVELGCDFLQGYLFCRPSAPFAEVLLGANASVTAPAREPAS